MPCLLPSLFPLQRQTCQPNAILLSLLEAATAATAAIATAAIAIATTITAATAATADAPAGARRRPSAQ